MQCSLRTNTYQTSLTAKYCNPEMAQLFSQRSRHLQWRRLWLLLVGLRKSLAITTDALEKMKQHLEVIDQDFETARAEELIRRHDVTAHVHAFGAVAPAAASIMHSGATSCFVTDNTKLILMPTTTLAYTHLQPDSANGRLVGKRRVLNKLQETGADVSGAQGTIGTQASFRDVLRGGGSKAGDIRHVALWQEAEKPLEVGQVGSNAMAFKRNPMSTLAARWMEGSLDDSAIRIDLPETFILTDAIIDSLDNVIATRVQEQLPFMCTESIVMKLVAKGVSRVPVRVPLSSMTFLINRIKAEEFLRRSGLILIPSMLKPELYIGCRVEIVERYCGPEGTTEKKVQPYSVGIQKLSTTELW
ncbi:adenylosuccinate lyase [Fusarium oxysporum]|nr:adenylosuccinate lyase [Fusarium oxysporum]